MEENTQSWMKTQQHSNTQRTDQKKMYPFIPVISKLIKKGISKGEMVQAYSDWSKDGKYDTDLSPTRYRGPIIASTALAELFKEAERSSKRILDLAAGSGLLGEELAKYGFTNIDALDPSEGMLKEAEKKKVYQNFLCQYFDNDSDIPDDSYDVIIISGGMGEGHIPGNSIQKMRKVVKKGGLVVIAMRKEYLSYVEDYEDLLPMMKKMEQNKEWETVIQKTVEQYSFNKQGMLFIFRVLQ